MKKLIILLLVSGATLGQKHNMPVGPPEAFKELERHLTSRFLMDSAKMQKDKDYTLLYDPMVLKVEENPKPKTPDEIRKRKEKELIELRKELVKIDSILSVVDYLLEKSYALDSLLGKPRKSKKTN